MNDHAERLIELFSECCELSPADRQMRLAQLSDESPELIEELSSLLAAHDDSEGFLSGLDLARAAEMLNADEALELPKCAGPYKLTREIGRGGLGVVYLGKRVEGDFDQHVAIKLIKRGMDSEQLLKRFQHERRILASLQHPNIARLIDGGLMSDGRPWFAMEYIEGMPIDQWCDQNTLSIRDRLKLFEQVCAAVQFAHARLIVHRDLKPANILVSADGTVKLLDFGIAKVMDETAEDLTSLTLAGTRAMTPFYAAPEQVLGEPVSVVTDVYALGLVLYELLVGWHPIRAQATSGQSLDQAICDTALPRPSKALEGDRAAEVAAARHSRVRMLQRHLRGDLDTIVLKAMARDPRRRYGSVEAMKADIRRHLDGLPVKARPETLTYRFNRFVHRHRIGVTAATAVLLALSAGLGLAMWQADNAMQQSARAEAAAERSERSLAFLTSLFHDGDPRNVARVDSIEELLAAGVARATTDLDDDRELQASILLRLAQVYYGRRQFEEALRLAEVALEGLHQLADSKDRRLADAYAIVGGAKNRLGRGTEAKPILRLAVEIYEDLGELEERASALSEIASVLRQIADPSAALELQEEILAEVTSRRGSDHAETIRHRQGLAIFAEETGDYGLAETELRQAIAAMERIGMEGEVTYATAVLNLASILDRLGQVEEAGELFERGIAARTLIYGADSPPVTESRFFHGIYLMGQRDYTAAEESFRLVAAASEISPGMRGHGHRYLGIALRHQGRYEQAIAEHESAERLYSSLGELVWDMQAYRSAADRGLALSLAGDPVRGAEVLSEAIAGIESIRGDSNYVLIRPLISLGEAQLAAGDRSGATLTAQRAAALAESLLGADHRTTLEAAARRDELLTQQ